jgi:TetR/AcrR family transcriptional regulator, regulator of cefoperazone and chloramphenicol sensitivity
VLQYIRIGGLCCYVFTIADSPPTRFLLPRDPAPAEPSSAERIRDAALRTCARNGIAGTSLRAIAQAAGTSVGLVQHYYGTKAALIGAVNEYVVRVINDALGAPIPASNSDALTEMGNRVTAVMAAEPDVFDYLGRALVEGDSVGSQIFDALVGLSMAQAEVFDERGEIRADVDPVWSALNPMMLRFGAIILRGHIERHLPEPFSSPAQLRRWDAAVTALLRHGQLKPD